MDATRTRHTVSDGSLLNLAWNHGRWFALPLGVGLVVYAVYLFTHPYPAFGSGLFLLMAEEIAQNGYHLPERIPYYTSGGVPFAYPPLAFYAVAAIGELLPVSPWTLSRLVPGLVTVAYLFPAYLLGLAVLDSPRRAAFATVLVAVSPTIFQWHLGAGGFVRATAFFFLLAGLAAGIRLFRTRNGIWLVPGAACFALTILSHPKYVVFYVLSYVLFWAVFDRSIEGLVEGAYVGVGGVVLTAPWWGQVVGYHGWEIFSQAAGTHRGVGNVALSVATLIEYRFTGPGIAWYLAAWRTIPFVAAAWLALRRRWFLPAWLLATVLLIGESRFVFLVGAFATTVALFDGVQPFFRRKLDANLAARATLAAFVVVAASGLAVGSAYAAGELNAHAGTATMPQYVNDDDLTAMEWVTEETDPDDSFVVLGDAAEWFPYVTERTMLVGPWGVEWQGDAAFQRQEFLFARLSSCPRATCLSGTMDRHGVHTEYLYVPRDSYTVRGRTHHQDTWLLETLRASNRYELVYENERVAIYRVYDREGF